MFNISQKLRRFSLLKRVNENEKLYQTMRAAANTIDGLQHEKAVYKFALLLLCRDTGADSTDYLTRARLEMLDAQGKGEYSNANQNTERNLHDRCRVQNS